MLKELELIDLLNDELFEKLRTTSEEGGRRAVLAQFGRIGSLSAVSFRERMWSSGRTMGRPSICVY